MLGDVSLNPDKALTAPADKPHIMVHRSVKLRMQIQGVQGSPYRPRLADWDELEPIFVD